MKRSKAVMIGGAILSILGMLLAYTYTQSARRTADSVVEAAATSETSAWVAATDLRLGSTWAEMAEFVIEQPVPTVLRPAQAISGPSEVEGKTLVRNISKGEVITSAQFNATGTENLSIPEGTSALTLSLPHPQGVGDYIQPGSKANFFVTVKDAAPDGVLTKLLLSDIPVLANRRALSAKALADGAEPEPGAGEVLLTFAVTTDQAERIIFAKENGAIWLTLRRPGEPAETGIGHTYGSFLR